MIVNTEAKKPQKWYQQCDSLKSLHFLKRPKNKVRQRKYICNQYDKECISFIYKEYSADQ